jgi:hypothetical protein
MNSKDRYIIEVLEQQCGYNSKDERYYSCLAIKDSEDKVEHLAFVTCTGVADSCLELAGYTLEFLDYDTNSNVAVAFEAELFEEVYNVAFDNFYRMTEEDKTAV